MVKCSFCGREEYAFKGVHLIKNDGTVAYFCSSKCRVNTLKLRRDKRKIRWTEAFREKSDKEKAKKARNVQAEETIAGKTIKEKKA